LHLSILKRKLRKAAILSTLTQPSASRSHRRIDSTFSSTNPNGECYVPAIAISKQTGFTDNYLLPHGYGHRFSGVFFSAEQSGKAAR
jgi:hypothetical protein